MRKLLVNLGMALMFAGALSACSVGITADANSAVTKVLAQLGNTLIPDLLSAEAVDMAKTPADIDGAQCIGALPDPTKPTDLGTGALSVAAAIQRVMKATGSTPGLVTDAEVAAAFQPGSAQFNWAVKTLETACIAKIHDINQAINSTVGIFTALPAILAVAAAPAGA